MPMATLYAYGSICFACRKTLEKEVNMDFICPICGGELAPASDNARRCARGHSFDRARAGYYNLLVGVGGGTHGDNREMVDARRVFLSRGYYEPLRERVSAAVLSSLAPGGVVLDVGCGEGYYTDRVERDVRLRDGESRVLAFDISRDAVKQLARKNTNISAAVASAYHIPVGDGTVDLAMLVFSPLATSELHRVLRVGGRLVMVFPDRRHLWGLKSVVYDTPYENKPTGTDLEGFRIVSDDLLEYDIELNDREAIRSLFMMTPYAYRTPREAVERVLSLESLSTEVAFRILVYERI